jgi:hypothetical protein
VLLYSCGCGDIAVNIGCVAILVDHETIPIVLELFLKVVELFL